MYPALQGDVAGFCSSAPVTPFLKVMAATLQQSDASTWSATSDSTDYMYLFLQSDKRQTYVLGV